jgi:localization factor PodJL
MAAIELEQHSDERQDGADAMAEGSQSATAEIAAILHNITALISAADRRQGDALSELQARLENLGREAQSFRARVPEAYAPSFERIEDARAQLAERISHSEGERQAMRAAAITAPDYGMPPMPAEDPAGRAEMQAPLADPTPSGAAAAIVESVAAVAPLHHHAASLEDVSAPAPLRSALSSADALRSGLRPDSGRLSQSGIDPFELVESTRPGNADEPWDSESAEALARVYDSLAGRRRPAAADDLDDAEMPTSVAALSMPPPRSPALDVYATTTPRESASHAVMPAAPTAAMVAQPPALDFGRDWLESRFADIASRVEETLSTLRADETAVTLDSRFEQFESRFGQALEGMATRSDIDSLREVETHLDELSQHVEQAQLQLQRLDTIEAQLNAVMDKLSDQRLSLILEQSVPSGLDAERIAAAAAAQVAERLASIKPEPAPAAPPADTRRLGELRDLIGTLMTERRQGDEQTTGMLDTIQQAMIRLLDRVDSLELSMHAPMDGLESDYAPEPSHAAPEPVQAPRQQPAAAAPAVASVTPKAAPPAEPAQRQEQPKPNSAESTQSAAPPAAAVAPTIAAAVAKPGTAKPAGEVTTRDQLIAEARRAMQAAAAKREADVAAKGDASGMHEMADRPNRVDAPAPASGGISKTTRRIMVGACSLLLLTSAVLLLMPRKPNSPVPPVSDAKATRETPAQQSRGTPPTTPAAPVQKGADLEPRGEAPRIAAPKSAVPKEFLPRTIPETGVDDLANPIDPAQDRGYVQEASGAAFPGITLHRNPDISPREAAGMRERQRLAEVSTRLGAAQAEAQRQHGGIPIALPIGEAVPQAQPARGEIETSSRTAPAEMPPLSIGPNSLRQAASKGDASAEFEVAARFAEGKGVQQSFQQALRWYQRSASQGFAPAQYRLGTLYERGLGVAADSARARVWYQRAAEQSHVKAMHNLAVLSASRDGGNPDYTTAARWFKEAAERGLADSQYNLAVLFESGLGVQKDLQQAYKWFSVASRAGDKEALRRLVMLRGKLATAEIAKGEQLVAAYVPKPVDRAVNDAHAAGEAWKARAQAEPQG